MIYRIIRADPPPPFCVRFGSFRRLVPISRHFGFNRGLCIDRYYIENFLEKHSGDVRGHVLEMADDNYTKAYGKDRVVRSDVLHAVPGNPKATLVGDLASGVGLPSNAFDCVILTQTLHLIYDLKSAIRTILRILKPGGVLLASLPGVSQISRYDMDRWGDCWRFTDLSARRLFLEAFASEDVEVKVHGNVLTAMAFLHGLSAGELKKEELDYQDPDYQVLLTVRARKRA